MIERLNPGHIDEVMRVFSDESVFKYITDDGSGSKESLRKRSLLLLHNVGVYFLSPRDGTIMMLVPSNYITFDIHVAAIEGEGRNHTGEDFLNCLVWMVENTKAMKFIANIPQCNAHVKKFAEKCGMRKEGSIKKAFMRDNILYDIDLFGATDEEVLAKKEEVWQQQ